MTSQFPFKSLLILLSVYYLTILSRTVFAPLLPVIEVEFGLTHAEAGALFLFIAFGQCAGLLVSGFVSSRLNHRRTIILSPLVMGGAMLAVSRSVSTSSLYACLPLVGISAGLYFPSGIATLTGFTSQQHWGKALALHEMPPNLAFITAPLFVEVLLKIAPWRGIIVVLGLASVLMGILFLFFGPRGSQKGEALNTKAMQNILPNLSFWVTAALFGLCVGAESGVYAMLPLFLVNEMGFARQWANTLLGFSRLAGFLVLFFSGVITDRIGHYRAMVLFLAVMGTLTFLLGVLHGPFITPTLIILQAASPPCFFPAALAVASLVFPSHLRSLGMSLLALVAVLVGNGAIPPGIGYVAEMSSFSFSFSLLGVLLVGMVPFTLSLRTYSRHSGKEDIVP